MIGAVGWAWEGSRAADGDGEAAAAVDGGVGCTEEVGAGPAAGGSDLSCSTVHATVLAIAIMTTLPATTIHVIRAGVSRCVGQYSPSSSDHAVCASASPTAEPSSVGATPVGAESSPSSPIGRWYRWPRQPKRERRVRMVWTTTTSHRARRRHRGPFLGVRRKRFNPVRGQGASSTNGLAPAPHRMLAVRCRSGT